MPRSMSKPMSGCTGDPMHKPFHETMPSLVMHSFQENSDDDYWNNNHSNQFKPAFQQEFQPEIMSNLKNDQFVMISAYMRTNIKIQSLSLTENATVPCLRPKWHCCSCQSTRRHDCFLQSHRGHCPILDFVSATFPVRVPGFLPYPGGSTVHVPVPVKSLRIIKNQYLKDPVMNLNGARFDL